MYTVHSANVKTVPLYLDVQRYVCGQNQPFIAFFAFECLEYDANISVQLWSSFCLETLIIRASGTIFLKWR